MIDFAVEKAVAEEEAQKLRKALGLSRVKGGDLADARMQYKLRKYLDKLTALAAAYARDSDSIPAGGFSGANSSTMRSSRSGTPIKVAYNGWHYCGQYSGHAPYAVQVQIGGALRYGHQNALYRVVNELLAKFSFASPFGASSLREPERGTNWGCVLLCPAIRYNDESRSSEANFPQWR